jgi:hypothetical protein
MFDVVPDWIPFVVLGVLVCIPFVIGFLLGALIF